MRHLVTPGLVPPSDGLRLRLPADCEDESGTQLVHSLTRATTHERQHLGQSAGRVARSEGQDHRESGPDRRRSGAGSQGFCRAHRRKDSEHGRQDREGARRVGGAVGGAVSTAAPRNASSDRPPGSALSCPAPVRTRENPPRSAPSARCSSAGPPRTGCGSSSRSAALDSSPSRRTAP